MTCCSRGEEGKMIVKSSEEGTGNYAYACARVKARKSKLLPRETYPRLLNMELPQIGRFIGEGQYRKEVDELASRYSGVDLIELATYLNLARTYTAILGFTRGDLRGMVRHYLNRWDVWNFKTVLRAKIYGASWKDVADEIIAAGAFEMSTFQEIFNSTTTEEMAATFMRSTPRTEYDSVLQRILRRGGPVPLADMENALDQEYYRLLLKSIPSDERADRFFLEYVRMEIDVLNLKTLFKLKWEKIGGEKASDLLIPGGALLAGSTLGRLAASDDYEKFLAELRTTALFEPVRTSAPDVPNLASLNRVLRDLDMHLMTRAMQFSHLYPLSVLPVIDYLLRKKTEVDNLRVVARGKQSGLPDETIRSLLVM
jgi:V/A-type H+-transporting ATPase subunit C